MGLLSSFFGASSQADSKGSAVDVVSYAASLASSPQGIDPFLDDLRTVTASLGPDGKLSESDQHRLANAYLKIEAYLINDEKLRAFTLEEIRGKIAQKFPKPNPDEAAFWAKIGTSAHQNN